MLNRAWWRFSPWILPSYLRGIKRIAAVGERRPASGQPNLEPDALALLVRAEAARLGFSQVGFAEYDARWTFAERAGDHDTGTVIICLLEEDYTAEQSAPSGSHEKRSMAQYAEQSAMLISLTKFLQDLGYATQGHDAVGPMLYIPYAVAAGLGQLGLNGQLLTPLAGARVTIMAITTEAYITRDAPRDFGIEAVCDACQACVRRCPVGAIPAARMEHRGVVKAKIHTGRCLATVIQADGCAVCSKVCPVQRFGLEEVYEHYESTGTVLGRGSETLEGYKWPLNGKFYGPGEKPRLDNRSFAQPSGLVFDVDMLFERVHTHREGRNE